MTAPTSPGRRPAGSDEPVAHVLGVPHHDGSELYVPPGVPRLGDVVPVRVRVPAGWGERAVHVRVVRDGEPVFVPARLDGSAGAHGAGERWYVADVLVHNPVTRYRFLLDRAEGYQWLNGRGLHTADVSDAADFRLSVHGGAPPWARDGVVYQIFPDRFARSGTERELPDWAIPAAWDDDVVGAGPGTPEQFFGGDLLGIEQHLDHLEALGVRTLYLTPVFPARSNHRYDSTTFERVDPLLGGDEALASLSRAVHARGMHLLGDFTTNHTGVTHEWFRRACADPTSPEAGFYYWHEAEPGYVGWLGVPSLPKLNYRGPGLMERMATGEESVTARWLRPPVSLDGWRIDVANMTGRHMADDFAGEVARNMRRTMAAIKPDHVLVAEHNHDYADDLVGDGWQASMNYAGFMRPVWSWVAHEDSPVTGFLGLPNAIPRRPGASVVATMREFASTVSWPVQLSQWNSLDTHDTPRLRTVTQDPALDRVACALLMTYPGTPMVFAGLELGATGLSGEHGRIPMPWDRPDRWDDHQHAAVRALVHLRNDVRALREGGMRWAIVHDDALAFLRETADERVLVVVARSPWPGAVLPASLVPPGAVPLNLLGGADLPSTERGLEVPGSGPGAQVWRLTSTSR